MVISNATRNGGRRNSIIIVLMLVVGALAYLNWEILSQAIDITPLSVQANLGATNQPSEGDELLAPPPARSRSDFAQTLSRPLFTANRRPVEKKPKVVTNDTRIQMAARDSAAEKFQLIGVYQDQGEKGRALIRSGPSAQGTWMSVGEDIEGWRLREVRNDVAVIETGGRRRELRLYPESDQK